MADPLPVHLSVPLRRVPGTEGLTLATDLQGSEAEVDACVYAAVNTPLGWRVDLPEFGRPGQVHRRGGVARRPLAGVGRVARELRRGDDRRERADGRGGARRRRERPG
jgi:hypothetical protein